MASTKIFEMLRVTHFHTLICIATAAKLIGRPVTLAPLAYGAPIRDELLYLDDEMATTVVIAWKGIKFRC